MNQRLNLTPKNSVKNNLNNRLKYVAAFSSITLAIFAIVFIYSNLSNNKSALANGSTQDDKASAVVLNEYDHWQSDEAAFSTAGASADGSAASCWNSGPNNNVWFRFKAIFDTVDVDMKTGGSEGTLKNGQLALFDSSGTELACDASSGPNDDLSVSYNQLTVDDWYYISVDNGNNASDTGTFTLAFNNVSSVIYYAVDEGDWNEEDTWSTSENEEHEEDSNNGNGIPHIANPVVISGQKVTITQNQDCASLTIDVNEDDTELKVQGGNLTVAGNATFTNAGHNETGKVYVKNTRTLSIGGNFTVNRNGGSKDFYIQLYNSAQLNIGGDFVWNSTAGSSKNTKLIVKNSASVVVAGNMTLNHTGGNKIYHYFKNSSQLNLSGSLTLNASGSNKVYMKFNNTAVMNLGGNLIRTNSSYGRLNFISSTQLTLNGSVPQTIATENGSGSEGITYNDVLVDNSTSGVPAVVLAGSMTVTNQLDLSQGIVKTDSVNLLIINSGATVVHASSVSYVEGPVNKVGNSDFEFPLGNGGVYAPISISAPASASSVFQAQYYFQSPPNNTSLGSGVNNVSNLEFWSLNQTTGTDQVHVSLSWTNSTGHGISDTSSLIIVRENATQWVNTGARTLSGNTTAGSMRSFSTQGSFGNFTIGSNGGGNALPIKLLSFDAQKNGDVVDLSWVTAEEINNDFFTIERSVDGQVFEELTQVQGAGTSSESRSYSTIDNDPLSGTSYYRLKQTDFNGQYEYFPMVAVDFENTVSTVSVVENLTVGPNPFSNEFTLSFSTEEAGIFEVNVMNMNGQLVHHDVMPVEYGQNRYRFVDRQQLPAGMYFVNLIKAGQILESKRIMKN